MSAVLGAVGSVFSAVGAIQQGQQAQQAYNYNAEVAANNATVARNAAAAQEQQKALETTRLIGTEKAAAGASGVDPNTGSPLAVMTDTAQRGTLDALRLRYQGTLQSNADISQAQLDTYSGTQAANAGYLKAASTVLTGGSNYANQAGLISGVV